MTRIAIVGPGAIGGTVAAWLAQTQAHELLVCARTTFERLEVVTPQRTLWASPAIITSADQARPVDWVLIATKAYDTAGAASWLPRLLGADTDVAILQNGVEHVERFAPFVPRERIVPVVVECPAERVAPGKIHQRRDAWMKVPDSPLGRHFARLFSDTRIDVQTTPDFRTAAWTKLCLNCAGAVSAVTSIPNRVARLPEVADLMLGLVRECVLVGRAEGAQLDDALPAAVVEGSRNAPPDGINSLLADRLARRLMEIDARNGVIVRFGAKHGIATPLNQAIVALLTALQREP